MVQSKHLNNSNCMGTTRLGDLALEIKRRRVQEISGQPNTIHKTTHNASHNTQYNTTPNATKIHTCCHTDHVMDHVLHNGVCVGRVTQSIAIDVSACTNHPFQKRKIHPRFTNFNSSSSSTTTGQVFPQRKHAMVVDGASSKKRHQCTKQTVQSMFGVDGGRKRRRRRKRGG